MEPLLQVEHLQVEFPTYAGTVQAVRDVSFSLEPGETLAIVGESGCGKSVTARAILGLTEQTGGVVCPGSRILFQGRDIFTYKKKEWEAFRGGRCGIIFQDALTSLNPTMKVGWQIAENLINHRVCTRAQARKEAVRLLGAVGLPDPEQRWDQYPHEFSGGMRQRAMIALALACKPDILIADEPTTALDVTTQAQILDILRSLQKEMGMAILLITHDLGVVAGMAKRVLVMYGGKLLEAGEAEQIFYAPRHPYTRALLRCAPRMDLECGQELEPIEGAPPSLIDPPEGCPFAPRCSRCMKICRREMPEYFAFEPGHEGACWLAHPDCPRKAGKEEAL